MELFSIETIAFDVFGYPLSWIELIGTAFGLICVWLAAKANILTWPTSLINIIAFFILFYQVNLYADMFLQVYFFVVTLYGWYFWKQKKEEKPIRVLSVRERWIYFCIIVVGTIVLGNFTSHLHELFPSLFSVPAAYPFADAFTTTTSILASILLARKIIENWILWITVDIVSVVLYYFKDIYFVSAEYFIFLLICLFGIWQWRKQLHQ